MPDKRITPIVVLSFAGLCLYLGIPTAAFAQAWVPAKGDGSVSVTYQNLIGRYHVDATGTRAKVGTDSAQSMLMDFEYGITDKLAFNADMVYVASKYQGRFPEGPLDFDASWHPALQDAHFSLRYNVRKNPLVITPFISVTVPTNQYETSGHNAVGRHFYELLVGVNAGRTLGPILPNCYVHGRYSYAILKRFAGLNLNRSNADWEVGWVATRRLTLRFLGAWQQTQGGLNFPEDIHPGEEEFEFHDRVLHASYFHLGGGATFSVNKSLDINLAYAGTVAAKNGLVVGGIAIGFSWRFSRGHDISKISAKSSPRVVPTTGQGMF
jgi:hypothetical protein